MAARRDPSCACAAVSAGLALMSLIAAAAHAQTDSAADPLHPSLRACAALNDDVERLACYDRAIELLASGKSTDAPTPSPEDVFGIDPQLSRETNPASALKRQDLAEITASVLAVQSTASGDIVLKLDNGQAWMLVDEKRAPVLRAGDTVKIVRAALGTFRLVGPDQRSARVRRVQ